MTASTPTHPANLSMKQNDGSSGPPSNGGMHGYSLVFVFSRNSKAYMYFNIMLLAIVRTYEVICVQISVFGFPIKGSICEF